MSFQYRIEIKGSGGEFCLGSISNDAGDYWVQQSKDGFLAHINDLTGGPDDLSDKGVALPQWHDINNFAHNYGIEDIDRILVLDEMNHSKVVADNAEPEWQALIKKHDLVLSDKFSEHTGYVLFSRSREKGNCIIDLSIEEPFDSRKLELREVDFWDHEIVVGFTYEGEELHFIETFGKSYDDNDCVLKAPDEKLWFE
ncbi:hypothetical protein [Qipengyuania sp. DGS5-3]|uniref:hypothetical protein n=1 Tax=Qipengyuania sp. DGS5-3 TaxID=3349632 RepID=UPI0036D4152A